MEHFQHSYVLIIIRIRRRRKCTKTYFNQIIHAITVATQDKKELTCPFSKAF